MPRLTARERREGYLREYAYQKKTGKPFFPYALFHDVAINLFFVVLIVGLTIVWYETAEQGGELDKGGPNGWLGPLYEAPADPAVEEYDPRPEWYFFFLFQLLRIFDKPQLLLLATIVIPTIWMIILIGMPFIDRGRERRISRRPIAMGFAAFMAILLLVLTWNGSSAPGAAGEAASAEGIIFANAPCASCHTLADAGTTGQVGPNLDSAHPDFNTVKDVVTNGKGGMPAFGGQYDEKKIDCLASYVSSVTNGGSSTSAGTGGAPSTPAEACAGVT